jgi:hypothetical protein
MRKILLTLFALALVVAFTAPAYAADFKLTGFYRIRGFSANNLDKDDDTDDSSQGLDALIRPRFNTSVDGGKIKAIWEIDWYENDGSANANAVLGHNGGGRVGVGTNRWMVDFAIPGSAFRARFGRTDYTSPDKEIFDSAGASRKPGIALYGKLSKNMSLSMFMFRAGASGSGGKVGAADENKDSYYAALGIKASPTVTLTPWVAMHRDGLGKSLSYVALHAKAKVGIFGLSATGVSVGGDTTNKAGDVMDASGWAFLVRSAASLGKMKLMANLTMLSGDDNMGDNEEGNFSNLFPNGGDIASGVLISGRGNIFFVDANERIAGNQSNGKLNKTNGAVIGELGLSYKVSKTFSMGAGIYVYNSAEADADGDDNFGTEFDVGMSWKIYSNLEMRAGFAYLAAGDYGADNDQDDSWFTAVSLRHIF